jgi:hypothetical protein
MKPRLPRAFSLSALLALLTSVPLLDGCASRDDAPAPAAAKGSLAGLASDTSGKPLAAVEVSTSPSTGYAVTDGAGEWKLSGVAAGTYTLIASRSGYATVEKPGVVVAADGSALVDFQLAPLIAVGDVVGRITDATTKTAIGLATVTTEAVTVQVETGGDGSYKLAGISVGSYKVRAIAKGRGEALGADHRHPGRHDDRRPRPLARGHVRQHVHQLSPPRRAAPRRPRRRSAAHAGRRGG